MVALSKSIADSEKAELNTRIEDDECDIFGKLIAKRMKTIKTDVIRMLAEQEILNVVTKKICEDQGLVLATASQAVGNVD